MLRIAQQGFILTSGCAAWVLHSTRFASILGCAHLFSFASLWTSPLQTVQPLEAGDSTGLVATGGSLPGLAAAGGAGALPQRLHGDILESFRQLAVRGRRLSACHEALPVQLHACVTPIHPH